MQVETEITIKLTKAEYGLLANICDYFLLNAKADDVTEFEHMKILAGNIFHEWTDGDT